MMNKPETSQINQARKIALSLIFDILEKDAYANLALDKALKKYKLAQTDRGLLTEMVNGTVRMVKRLDWVLNLFLSTAVERQNPWLKNILRMSLYQIMFMERVPVYAIVDDAVKLSSGKCNRALAGVCNAVLRNIIRNPDKISYPPGGTREYLSAYYSFPLWIVEIFINQLGIETTENILSFFNLAPQVAVRANLLQTSRDELMAELTAEGFQCSPSLLSPWGVRIDKFAYSIAESPAYMDGHFYVQNEGSMLAAAILAPLPGDHVGDLCCGVGGKTTHLAELMNNTGSIQAYEIYERKLQLLQANCDRLGITMVNSQPADVLSLSPSIKPFSRLLLDAPCSGLGVLNRRADLRWHKRSEDLHGLQALQAQLMARAGQLVDHQGLLLYSTCTVNPGENEHIITEFLSNNSDYYLQGFADKLQYLPLDEADRNSAARGMLTLLPGKYQTDGMFYALMRRK